MPTKLKYDDIKIKGQVKSPYNQQDFGEIVAIENFASLRGINEPIFCVKFKDNERMFFGLKYVLKYYVTI
jgi:hypothetical protein